MRMRMVLLAASLSALAGCTATNGTSAGDGASVAAVRPAEDVARDAGRKPYEVLSYLGVGEGMTVLDIIAAGGYYTEVMADVVGPEGVVYAQNPARVLRFFGGNNDRAMNNRLRGGRLPNVRRLDREFQDLGILKNSVDVAITALNFHDVYNNSPEAAAAILQTVKGVLKPGGTLGIIDHVGDPNADNKALHRIDPALAVAAAESAGFLVERSDLLANPADDHTQSPFAEGLRGQTDRFLLKLTKPAES